MGAAESSLAPAGVAADSTLHSSCSGAVQGLNLSSGPCYPMLLLTPVQKLSGRIEMYLYRAGGIAPHVANSTFGSIACSGN